MNRKRGNKKKERNGKKKRPLKLLQDDRQWSHEGVEWRGGRGVKRGRNTGEALCLRPQKDT